MEKIMSSKRPLNLRQGRFLAEYLISFNASDAARRAGFSVKTADVQGSRLLRNVRIRAAIAQAQACVANRAEVTVERVVRELGRIAFVDPAQFFDQQGNLLPISKMPEDCRRAIAALDIEELFARDENGKMRPSGLVKKLKFAAKIPALDLLARHLGMLQAPQAATPASLGFQINIWLNGDTPERTVERPATRIEREEP